MRVQHATDGNRYYFNRLLIEGHIAVCWVWATRKKSTRALAVGSHLSAVIGSTTSCPFPQLVPAVVSPNSSSSMTTRPARRPRKNSYDEEYEDEAAPSSKRAPSNRRAPAQEPMDTLTSEEQYLMRVFRQFRKQTLASPQNSTAPNSPQRSVSPSRSSSVLEKRSSPAAASAGKVKVARETDRALDGVSDAKTRDPSPPPPPSASQPTDKKARLKMVLERKRMAQAGPRAGSAAATSGAGVQRKAKINKVLGGSSSSAGPKLDPMKVLLWKSRVF